MEAVNYTKNILQKGLNTNVDNIRFPADSAWEILNGRIYSVDGENFVVKNIDGNQLKFSLSPGYTLIGAKEYDEILYLVSARRVDDVTTTIEVGTYPSLSNQLLVGPYNGFLRYGIWKNEPDIHLVNEYKPLPAILRDENNPLIPHVYGFRTNSFGFIQDNIIFPLIKESHDGTVNIYLCDGENFNRVVNSGFSKKELEIKYDRLYTGNADSFSSIDINVNRITKQFLSINEPPYTRLTKVGSGGNLPVGNLFFYIRYLDYEFNKTNFVPLLGPVMITYGDDIFSVSGNNPSGLINYAKKNITMSISHIDKAYKYFEIAMIWNSGTEEIGLGTFASLINKRIPITTTSFDFTITGLEEMAEISQDEVLRDALKETTCSVAEGLDGRYFGANWKEVDYDRDAMIALAKKVWVRPELWNRNTLLDLDGNEMKDYDLYEVDDKGPELIDKKYWYQSPEFVLDRVGYYRGEIYPFALVGLKEDGSFTEPFPITGHDYYNDSDRLSAMNNFNGGNDLDGSNAGLVRMPQFGTGNTSSVIDNMDYILIARAELKHMWIYLNEHMEDFKGIKGFYVVRGDRIKNLMYHGVNLSTSESAATSGNYFFGIAMTRERTIIGNKICHSFPTIDAYPRFEPTISYPATVPELIFTIPSILKTNTANCCEHFYSKTTKHRKAFYSPDILLSNINRITQNDQCYVYIPYSNYPQFGLSHYSQVNKISYIGGSSQILHGSVYNSRFNYLNNRYGRASKEGKLIRGLRSHNMNPSPLNQEVYFFDEHVLYDNVSMNWIYDRINLLQENNSTWPYWSAADLDQDNDYIKCIGTNVRGDTYGGLNSYSSYFGDGLFDSINVGYICAPENSTSSYANADIKSIDYLGLEYTDVVSYLRDAWDCMNMMPLLVYSQKNDAAYYTDVVNRYLIDGKPQMSEINYKITGVYCDKENTRFYYWNNEQRNLQSIYMNGDCFINRFTFRAMHNQKVFDLYVDTDDKPIHKPFGDYYNHGNLFSICLQSDSNSSVRAIEQEGFHPLWASNWKPYTDSRSANSVLCARFGGSTGVNDEDFIYDWGHSETLPLNVIPGINDIYKNRNLNHLTRVRYSDKHQETAFIDGWRSMYYLSKADFPIEFGMIMGIGVIGSSFIISTMDSVQQLFVNEKAISSTEQGGNLTIGLGSILYEQSKLLGSYGSQHRHIVSTDNGVYGYDYKRSIFWRVIASTTSTGSTTLGCKIVSENISSFLINRRKEDYSLAKVIYGYNEKEREVLLTVKHNIIAESGRFTTNNDGSITFELPSDYNNFDWCGYVVFLINGLEQIGTIEDLYNNTLTVSGLRIPNNASVYITYNYGFTLSYNEKISSAEVDFITRLGISPDIYSSLKDVIMTSNNDLFPSNVYSHDNILEKHTFYGYNSWFKYGIVVNNGATQATHTQTIFGSFMITSDEEAFDVIDYETEFQKCRHNPFMDITRFWVTPEYKENRWDFTVPENETTNNGYLPDSNMRGIWLKTLLIYKGKNSKYIGEIINKNVLSFA